MDAKIIKKLINELPITGDKLIEIKDNYAIYKSGGKIQISNSTRLKVGDIVTGVYHGHEKNTDQIKIYVNVDHLTGDSVSECSEYLKIKRDFILTELLGNDND
ncbi:MAG: hypothetical protein LC096_08745 [Bacteroidia bacterium]|nr:hypothetical protein [Bacteroidia bacterium]